MRHNALLQASTRSASFPAASSPSRPSPRRGSRQSSRLRGPEKETASRSGSRVLSALEPQAEVLIPEGPSEQERSAVREADVVVIGSGIGGLSCAAILATYGFKVVVLESHYCVGGAAHGWKARGKSGIYHFESGPSLYSGMESRTIDGNPLGHIFQAIGEELDWVKYDSWRIYFPEGEWNAKVGKGEFLKIVSDVKGPNSRAAAEWKRLEEVMKDFAPAAAVVPPIAFRNDLGALFTVGLRYLPSLLRTADRTPKLLVPFSKLIEGIVTDQFLLDYLDLLSFLLSGLPADGTIAAEMAVMFNEWYKPNCCLEFPRGGSQAVADTLVKCDVCHDAATCHVIARSIEKNGGRVLTKSHVEEILFEGKRANGVRLRNGQRITAKKAVVSNASIWDTIKIIPPERRPADLKERNEHTPLNRSFMHLHIGFDATDLDVDLHHIVVNEWRPRVDSEQNVVLISIPSVVDPSFAPPGKHSLHAYLPATEPYDIWRDLDTKSDAYAELKRQRGEVLWKGVERVIPDIRERAEIAFVGTPLTHERFLRRHQGTYGPAISAADGFFPSQGTSIPGLFCCGDSTFPGIGLPAVAASGAIAANTLAPLTAHWALLSRMGF